MSTTKNHGGPNSHLPGITGLDWLQIAVAPIYIPLALFQLAYRRIGDYGNNDVPLWRDITVSVIKSLAGKLPFSVNRVLSNGDANKVLNSPRFKSKIGNLYEQVLQGDVAGYWMCKGPAGKYQDPTSCDIVIYYIHGGAYVSGHPAAYLTTALRTAEIADEQGISISIFALQYTYGSEKHFPAQIDEAAAGYRYLIENQKIDASKIAVLGASAGAHLATCLLTELSKYSLPKPGRGVFLISPWVDLSCSMTSSYRINKHKDFLDRDFLLECTEKMFPDQKTCEESPFLDLSKPLQDGRSWKDIMPSRVWVTAGSHEVFLDEIIRFAESLRADGVDVDLKIEEGGLHVWQNVTEAFDLTKYLTCTDAKLPEGLMRGSANIAGAMLVDLGK